jgi:hypothetical protein
MPTPHTHEPGESAGTVTLADEVVQLYHCRHCPRLILAAVVEEVWRDLEPLSCRCAGRRVRP